MSNPHLGEIRIVPYTFAPRGWAFCNGQLLPISLYDALFALIGTTYGGDGQTTFALPDLQSRHTVGTSDNTYPLGQAAGEETVTLTPTSMPTHTHQASGQALTPSDSNQPSSDAVWGLSTTALYATAIPPAPTTGATTGQMAPDSLELVGGSQPHENRPPLLALHYVIALEGVFPSRN